MSTSPLGVDAESYVSRQKMAFEFPLLTEHDRVQVVYVVLQQRQ